MRPPRQLLAALFIICGALGACSDDKPSANATTATIAQASSDTSGSSSSSGSDATQPPAVGGAVDCAALQSNLADIVINWQVVIGMTNSPTSEWSQIPLGSIPKFGDQLAAVSAALGSDAAAADALTYMSGANDIVKRGLGGDSAAQADLTAYLGTDVGANVGKQLPISIAYQNAGCK
ncbi:MAG TPA: hypothetical protein VHN36_10265 [Ilumatobacteraceae bacterium]|nr:hypothetical protein [Ilumatobacteraceae bacterium]